LLPDGPVSPTFRDVQLALAREFGLDGWTTLKTAPAGSIGIPAKCGRFR
jgi:hypothetical protein